MFRRFSKSLKLHRFSFSFRKKRTFKESLDIMNNQQKIEVDKPKIFDLVEDDVSFTIKEMIVTSKNIKDLRFILEKNRSDINVENSVYLLDKYLGLLNLGKECFFYYDKKIEDVSQEDLSVIKELTNNIDIKDIEPSYLMEIVNKMINLNVCDAKWAKNVLDHLNEIDEVISPNLVVFIIENSDQIELDEKERENILIGYSNQLEELKGLSDIKYNFDLLIKLLKVKKANFNGIKTLEDSLLNHKYLKAFTTIDQIIQLFESYSVTYIKPPDLRLLTRLTEKIINEMENIPINKISSLIKSCSFVNYDNLNLLAAISSHTFNAIVMRESSSESDSKDLKELTVRYKRNGILEYTIDDLVSIIYSLEKLGVIFIFDLAFI